MVYNLDFLYAAIAVCLFLSIHLFYTRNNYQGVLPRFVNAMIILVFICAVADIVASKCIMSPLDHSLLELYLSDEFLYTMQAALPYCLFLYSLGLCGDCVPKYIRYVMWSGIWLIISWALILTTHWTGLVFSFDAITHEYSYGPLRPIVFVECLIYALCIIGMAFRNKRFLREIDFETLLGSIVLLLVCIVIQAAFTDVAFISFGAACIVLLLFLSLSDPVGLGDMQTGVFDSGEFRRRIACLTAKKVSFCVTFVKLTNRRYIANTYGSEVSDNIVRNIAKALMKHSRSKQVYHFHQGRFAIICYHADEANLLKQKIEAWFAGSHIVDKYEVTINAEVKVIEELGEFPDDENLDAYIDFLIEDFEQVLHTESENPREYFQNQRDLQRTIEKAFELDTFELRVQPLFNVATNSFDSIEVLSRLKNDDGMYISPEKFISALEEDGRISEFTKLQFGRLCRYISSNKEELIKLGLRDVKFNVSPVELGSNDHGKRVVSFIELYGIDPKIFSFELTETAATSDNYSLVPIMHDFKDAGCRVYMDDFGSGFANLEAIYRLPFDGVKIDYSLLKPVLNDNMAADFYHGIVDAMHAMGKIVVSEGVEQKEEQQLLSNWSVDLLQGYYLSKPILIDDLVPFLKSHNC